MRASAKRKTMTATSTPMRLKSMLPTRRAGPGQRLTAAAVWVNDGIGAQREPSSDGSRHLGWQFLGTAEPMTTFAFFRFSGKHAQGAGIASLPRLAGAISSSGERGILGLHAAQLWSAILRGLRQRTSRITPSPAYLPRSSKRTSPLFLAVMCLVHRDIEASEIVH